MAKKYFKYNAYKEDTYRKNLTTNNTFRCDKSSNTTLTKFKLQLRQKDVIRDLNNIKEVLITQREMD